MDKLLALNGFAGTHGSWNRVMCKGGSKNTVTDLSNVT